MSGPNKSFKGFSFGWNWIPSWLVCHCVPLPKFLTSIRKLGFGFTHIIILISVNSNTYRHHHFRLVSDTTDIRQILLIWPILTVNINNIDTKNHWLYQHQYRYFKPWFKSHYLKVKNIFIIYIPNLSCLQSKFGRRRIHVAWRPMWGGLLRIKLVTYIVSPW